MRVDILEQRTFTLKFRTLTYVRYDLTVHLTLNRPHLQNQVDLEMAQEINQVCELVRQETELRVVVITGEGLHFSVGDDASVLAEKLKRSPRPDQLLQLYRPASALAALPVPLVAAINGDALDHGLELALACDVIIASENARLGMTQLKRGILPWDGGTQRLARLVGRAWALEMLLTGRVLTAHDAARIKLISKVTSPALLMRSVEEVCETISSKAPIAARYAKEAVIKGLDMTLEQGLRLETDLNILLHRTGDRSAGISSFVNKEEPRFTGQ